MSVIARSEFDEAIYSRILYICRPVEINNKYGDCRDIPVSQ
jgi:hypothetical protein